jgi:hypothetical protein
MRESVETYPEDPNPSTVDLRFDVLIPPPGPNAVEKEEKLWEMKLVVEMRDSVETYPEDPNPCTVETKLFVSALTYAVEKEEKD